MNLTDTLIDYIKGNDSSANQFLKEFSAEVKSKRSNKKSLVISQSNVSQVIDLGTTNDYVYDVSMIGDNKWFFGNDALVSNTDSVYFTVYPELKEDIEAGKMSMSKDDYITLYDQVGESVSSTFPDFLLEKFNVPKSLSTGVVAAGREIVAETGLFIKKKRYAAMVYDKEGIRQDTDGKPGKIKAMGLDLRRSDTPKFIQVFLMTLLKSVLLGKLESEVLEQIKEFREEFLKMYPWQKGSPKGVNNLTAYQELEEAAMIKRLKGQVAKVNLPGHVRAALNWNFLREKNNDLTSLRILDGQKIIVCKLKQTPDNFMTSIAYPVDETRLPDWFTTLPFDEDEMENILIDKKLKNLLGVLKWDLDSTSRSGQHFTSLFDMSVFDEAIDEDDEDDEDEDEDEFF